jgi:hypothetical protein
LGVTPGKVPGGDPSLGHDHVRAVHVGQPDEVTRVGGGADDFKIPFIEDAVDALANE